MRWPAKSAWFAAKWRSSRSREPSPARGLRKPHPASARTLQAESFGAPMCLWTATFASPQPIASMRVPACCMRSHSAQRFHSAWPCSEALSCSGLASGVAWCRSNAYGRRCWHRRVDAEAPLPPLDPPPELQPLIDTIGHLLRRVQQAIEHERRFTDDAAHELRTPLTVVKTHLQVLRLACANIPLDDVAGQALSNAEHGVARLHRTLEQLFVLARLEGSTQTSPPAKTDALHAARQAIDDSATEIAADCRVSLQTTLASANLAVSEPLLVSALRNLLDNALRHSPHPGSVALRIEALSGEVVFSVLDAGPGMVPDERAHALQRFWRRGDGNGSGLGLSIVDAIATRHGGQLRLLPRNGGGLEARLCLPMV